jgi:hypothetical protein
MRNVGEETKKSNIKQENASHKVASSGMYALYKILKEDGLKSSFDDFCNNMRNTHYSKMVYNYVNSLNYDVGNYDDYQNWVSKHLEDLE